MLVKLWRKGNIHSRLVGVQTYNTTMKVNVVVPQKARNHSTSTPFLDINPKKCFIVGQRANNQGRGEEERGKEGKEGKRGEKEEESENKKIVVSPQRCHCLLFSNILSFSSIVFQQQENKKLPWSISWLGKKIKQKKPSSIVYKIRKQNLQNVGELHLEFQMSSKVGFHQSMIIPTRNFIIYLADS